MAAVSFTITTADDALGKKPEPGAPLVSDRFKAIQILAQHNIHTGVLMMPILPFIEGSRENITEIVRLAHEHGASYILGSWENGELGCADLVSAVELASDLLAELASRPQTGTILASLSFSNQW